jgi:hypothetical protein
MFNWIYYAAALLRWKLIYGDRVGGLVELMQSVEWYYTFLQGLIALLY